MDFESNEKKEKEIFSVIGSAQLCCENRFRIFLPLTRRLASTIYPFWITSGTFSPVKMDKKWYRGWYPLTNVHYTLKSNQRAWHITYLVPRTSYRYPSVQIGFAIQSDRCDKWIAEKRKAKNSSKNFSIRRESPRNVKRNEWIVFFFWN